VIGVVAPSALRVGVVGATGLVGGHATRLLLEDQRVGLVRVLARRAPALAADEAASARLELRVIDFDAPSADDFAGLDALACCLGTTRAQAGSAEAFRRVDFGYVVASARLARAGGATRLAVVSALGADARSSVFYNRVKGEADEAVSALGYTSVHVLRPSLLLGARAQTRLGERVGAVVLGAAAPMLVGPLAPYRAIEGEVVARALVRWLADPTPGVFVHRSDAIAAHGVA
jgi:uncharacterized protein YbjT (DUF2867 family)